MTSDNDQRICYKILVQGELDQDWEAWFNGFVTSMDTGKGEHLTTTLTVTVADQSALRGIINKLWDLNLVLISVQRMDTEKQ